MVRPSLCPALAALAAASALALAMVPSAAASAASLLWHRDEIVQIEWKGTTWRVGGPIPVRVKTAVEEIHKDLHAKHLVLKASDGRERRVRTTADESKLIREDGYWNVDCDAGGLSDTPPPGKFELWYQITDDRKSNSLYGTLYEVAKNPTARLEKDANKLLALFETDEGPILLGLRPDKAPRTVQNFVKLVSDGFYDGKTFHRIRRGALIQGGAVKPDGTVTTSASIPLEASDLGHERGAISMARLPADPNSGTCQFFFCITSLKESCDGKYAVFGKVHEGIEVMDRIALAPVLVGPDNEKSKPVKPPVIQRVSIVEKP
ncbi:MAG: peptidylprolyl isomerase [Planctomycetes bacterium]|nr:peptidylprolyl isomerase [Planctomycetota bacterium]